VLAVLLGCSHDTKPVVQPDEHPPLPPSSGTPIGYLVDDATELKLRDDQLTQLKTIDTELSARLDVLDTELRGGSAAPASSSTPTTGRRRGGRRGGMGGSSMGGGGMGGGSTGGGGMGGRGMRGGRGAGGSNAGSGAGSGSAAPNQGGRSSADAVNRAAEERRADVHEALERAFALFDPTQKEIAKRVLSDRGVDLDTDHATESPSEAEPGAGSGEP
jgi:hypothetical protein